jgi:hypothetical protein
MRRLALPFASLVSLVTAACTHTHAPATPIDTSAPEAHVPLRCESRRLDVPAPGSTEPRRVEGRPWEVRLSDATVVDLHSRRIERVSLRPHFCLDATGKLECIDFMDQAPPRSVAQDIVDAFEHWQVSPYLVAGAGHEFCTQLNLNYKIQ